MTDYMPSIEVLKEYEHIANWLERKSVLLGPVGDTMHALAAEAFWRLLAVAKEVHEERVAKEISDAPTREPRDAEYWVKRKEQFGRRQ